MRRHRAITMTATLLAVAATSAAPAAAGANSLLSGYGGPGQGNQAILGSALLGGPSGGGGTSGPAGAGSAEVGGGSAAGTPRGHEADPPALGKSENKSRSTGHRATGTGKDTGGATPPAIGLGAPTYARTAALAGDTSAPALGLSGADVVYILLAAGALVLTGLATRRVARETR
jgi:hypothetical protein